MTKANATRFDEEEIDRIFADVDQCQLPGAAVAVAINGVPVYRKGFGLANMELPTLLTPTMRMRIGSTTKHFAALAYMLLCEEGLAGLDDEIGNYVPGLLPANSRATMRRLIGHTSGIRDLMSVTMTMHGPNRPVTDAQMIDYYRTIDDVDFEPGTRWSYNNGAYMLLSAAIETITGKSLEDVLRARIFEPVGMNDTMLRRWDSDFVRNSATLHNRDAKGNWSRTYMGMEISGAGGMVSSMDDMLRWLNHMDAPIVGSAETWRVMREPHRLANGVSTGYGLGLMTTLYRGVETVHHAGGVMGGNSQMIKVPSAGLDISIAVNRTDASGAGLAYKIIDTVVEGLEPEAEKAEYDRRTGIFVSGTDGRVVSLSIKDDLHMMSVDGGPPVPVTPNAAGVLQLPAAASFLQQTARAEGEGIIFSDFGNEDRLDPIEGAPDAKLGDRAGTYRSETLDGSFTLIEDEQGARAVSRGRHGWADYSLEPVARDIWRVELASFPGAGGILRFEADGQGFTLDFTRMRRVRFTKVSG